MIHELTVSGIKAFKSRQVVPFAECALISGKNSSGKSTIFQTLLLLKQAFERPPRAFAGIHLNGDSISVGTYEDWSSDRTSAPSELAVSIRANSTQADALGWWRRGRGLTEGSVKGTFAFGPDKNEPTLAKLLSLSYKSENTRLPHIRKWSFSAAPRPTPASNSLLFAEDDPEVQFTVASTSERITPDGSTPGDRRSGSGIAAITGLNFSTLMQQTSLPAAKRTLRRTIRVSIDGLLSHLTSGKAISGFRVSAIPSDAVRLMSDATGEQLALYWETLVDLRSALFSASDANDAWHSAALALSNRLRVLCRQAELQLPQPDREFTEDLNSLREEYPDLEPFLGHIESFAAVTTVSQDVQDHLDVRILVRRAKSELLSATHTYRTVQRATDVLDSDPTRAAWEGRDLQIPTDLDFQSFFENYVFHLGPLRDEPRSLYVSALPNDAADIGRNGQRAIECLRRFGKDAVDTHLPNERTPRRVTLIDATREWCRHLGITDTLNISQESKYGTVCRVSTPGGKSVADLTNVGVGVSQALPVIILCLAAPRGATILLEQPELHLHPSAQVALAALFVSCIASGKQLIIETHSEHLINGLRLAVAQQKLSSQMLSVLFLSRDDFGTDVSRVSVREDGSIERWPLGFFDEAEQTLLKLIDSKLTKHGNTR